MSRRAIAGAVFMAMCACHGSAVRAPAKAPEAPFTPDAYGDLVSINSDGSWSKDAFAARFAKADVAATRRLDVSPCDEGCLEALVESPVASQLVELSIPVCFNGPMAKRLAAAEQMTSLRSLFLGGCGDTMDEGEEDFRQYEMEESDFALLVAAPHLANLRWLEMEYQGVCDEGIERLVSSPFAKHLERLAISHSTCIGDRGARSLASGALPRLRVLDLTWGEITTEGARALIAEGALPALQTLLLDENDDIDEAVREEISRRYPRLPAP